MVVDVGMQRSLMEAGLVGEDGAFLSQPNFGGPSESDPWRREERSGDDDPFAEPSPERPEAPAEVPVEKQEPASQPQVRPAESAPPGPSGPDLGAQNPNRLGDADDPVRQNYDRTIAQLEQTAMLAFANGRAAVNEQGERLYTDEFLARQIGQELQAAQQQAFLGAVMQKMQPVAKRAAAEGIAKEFEVDVDDILNEESPQEMRARAKTIADLKRDGRFTSRKESGADIAEGSRSFSNTIPAAIENLSPQQKMYIGFARGDH